MSSVSLSKAVCVELNRRKPVCFGSSVLVVSRCSISCECAIFSSTFGRKQSKAMGQKTEGDDGALLFFRGTMFALFQRAGKLLVVKEELKSLTKRLPMTGSALTMTLCGMPSAPRACDEKWNIAMTTSLKFMGLKEKPSELPMEIILRHSSLSSRGETETPAKWQLSSSGVKPFRSSVYLGKPQATQLFLHITI